MGEIIGIISIKGGVGKTTTTVSLAAALSREFNKKILAVDSNFSAPNLGLHLGVVKPEVTIHDVLAGKATILDAIMDTGYGFDLIPASIKYDKKTNYLELKRHLTKIKKNYDIILLDSSPNLNNEILATITASDKLLVITTPDYPTLSCTMRAVRIAQKKGTPIAGMILNKVYGKDFELSLEEIEKGSTNPILAVLPHDLKMLEALSLTQTPHMVDAKGDAVVELNHLAGALVGEEYKDPRIFNGLRSRFNKNKKLAALNRDLFIKEEFGEK